MTTDSVSGVSRKLVDHIVGPAELGPPRSLFATTFDLSPEFVDIDFLPSLLRLPAFDDRRVRSRVLLEGQLATMRAAAILVERRRYQGRPRSLRVDVRPASKRGTGVLHAKVVLLVHDDAVRLVVGSANLTTTGYRENREVAFALRADRKRPEEATVVRQALEEMPKLLEPWWSESAQRVREDALEVLERIGSANEAENAAFVWGGGEVPLWRQVLAFWPQGEAIERIRIVSPFWSEETGDGPIARLLGELRMKGALTKTPELLLVTSAQGETSTTYRPVLPPSYGTFDFGVLGIAARAIAAKPQVDEEDLGRDDIPCQRALHAKVLLLEGPRTAVAYAGSANFTVPGWGFGSREAANIEAGVVLRGKRGRGARTLAALIPPTIGEPISLDGAAASATRSPPPEEPESDFPRFVLAAELQPSSEDGKWLVLIIRTDVSQLPSRWSVAIDEQGEPLLTVSESTGPEHRIDLDAAQLNALLRARVLHFRWTGQTGERLATYPVNIALSAREKLPFADPESFPGESDLVAFYQGRVAWEDLFPLPLGEAESDAAGPGAMPSMVDTTQILSYQVRSFVEALQGIRDELKNAAVTETTFRLALLGPVSPVALATQVYEAVMNNGRSPTAGGFQLVELLACIRDMSSLDVGTHLADAWRRACAEAATDIAGKLATVRAQASPLREGSQFDRYAKAVMGRVVES
jgi:phosphatidylserine/phosphatidylglycerophosphate/cardiolipin synthase-like enzyme